VSNSRQEAAVEAKIGGSRIDDLLRTSGAVVVSIAAAIFLFTFCAGLFACFVSIRRGDQFEWWALFGILAIGGLAFLTTYIAWRFSKGTLSSNGTMLPNWALWAFGLMMAAGVGIAILDELRTQPYHVLWWLALVGVLLTLDYVLPNVHKQRLFMPLLFAAWIGGNYFIEGTVAWGDSAFLIVWLGLVVATKIRWNQRAERKDSPT
jgi:hypothetical protein